MDGTSSRTFRFSAFASADSRGGGLAPPLHLRSGSSAFGGEHRGCQRLSIRSHARQTDLTPSRTSSSGFWESEPVWGQGPFFAGRLSRLPGARKETKTSSVFQKPGPPTVRRPSAFQSHRKGGAGRAHSRMVGPHRMFFLFIWDGSSDLGPRFCF